VRVLSFCKERDSVCREGEKLRSTLLYLLLGFRVETFRAADVISVCLSEIQALISFIDSAEVLLFAWTSGLKLCDLQQKIR
jgi:hypothetical protein